MDEKIANHLYLQKQYKLNMAAIIEEGCNEMQ